MMEDIFTDGNIANVCALLKYPTSEALNFFADDQRVDIAVKNVQYADRQQLRSERKKRTERGP